MGIITGTVTYKQTKVADGWITFVPKNAGIGTQEAARITDGNYELPSANGLMAGESIVWSSLQPKRQRNSATEAGSGRAATREVALLILRGI